MRGQAAVRHQARPRSTQKVVVYTHGAGRDHRLHLPRPAQEGGSSRRCWTPATRSPRPTRTATTGAAPPVNAISSRSSPSCVNAACATSTCWRCRWAVSTACSCSTASPSRRGRASSPPATWRPSTPWACTAARSARRTAGREGDWGDLIARRSPVGFDPAGRAADALLGVTRRSRHPQSREHRRLRRARAPPRRACRGHHDDAATTATRPTTTPPASCACSSRPARSAAPRRLTAAVTGPYGRRGGLSAGSRQGTAMGTSGMARCRRSRPPGPAARRRRRSDQPQAARELPPAPRPRGHDRQRRRAPGGGCCATAIRSTSSCSTCSCPSSTATRCSSASAPTRPAPPAGDHDLGGRGDRQHRALHRARRRRLPAQAVQPRAAARAHQRRHRAQAPATTSSASTSSRSATSSTRRRAVEDGTFDAACCSTAVAVRDDALGNLARIFQHMACEVAARERALKQQVRELRIEIDEAKAAAPGRRDHRDRLLPRPAAQGRGAAGAMSRVVAFHSFRGGHRQVEHDGERRGDGRAAGPAGRRRRHRHPVAGDPHPARASTSRRSRARSTTTCGGAARSPRPRTT